MAPKLGFVLTRFVPGGARRVVLQIIRGLDRSQYEVELITGAEGFDANDGELVPSDVVVHEIPSLVRNINPVKDVRAFFELVKMFRRQRYDLVHTHTSKAGLLGRCASIVLPGSSLVHTPHGLIYEDPDRIPGLANGFLVNDILLRLERFAGWFQDALTTLTDREARRCVELGLASPESVRRIYNGVSSINNNSSLRHEIRSRYGISEEETLIVSVGRLSAEKGHDVLLESFEQLRSEYSSLRLLIAGEGPEREKLESKIAREDSLNVVLTGFVRNIEAVYNAGDIFVLPSLYEGFGLAVLEAMSAGLPVVATRVGGLPEIIRSEQDGLLVEPDNPSALAEALRALIEDETYRNELSTRAIERSREFTVDEMVKQYSRLYGSLLDEG